MSFQSRLALLFGGGSVRPGVNALSVGKPRPGSRRRDPVLEDRAREILRPLAPALADTVVAGWNTRMRTTAGVALLHRREVWLNPALREVSAGEVERTLRHELAHLLAAFRHGRRRLAPHGPEWSEACRDLGIAGEERTHRLPFQGRRLKRRYLLRCPGCGGSHERVRVPHGRIACLACCRLHHGGRYHERFRFQVLPLGEVACQDGVLRAGDQRSPK